jgi:hypothetical protein
MSFCLQRQFLLYRSSIASQWRRSRERLSDAVNGVVKDVCKAKPHQEKKLMKTITIACSAALLWRSLRRPWGMRNP